MLPMIMRFCGGTILASPLRSLAAPTPPANATVSPMSHHRTSLSAFCRNVVRSSY